MQLAAMSRAKYYKKIVALIMIYFFIVDLFNGNSLDNNCSTGTTLCVRNADCLGEII